jgi:outer membrane protein OmpA-like peptidoglycan-associated protein
MKIIPLYLISILFLLIVVIGKTQNLVPNNSFEKAWTCPQYFTTEPIKELVPSWKNPNRGTPDYFHTCSDSMMGIPENFAGNAISPDGSAYIGLIMRETFDTCVNKKGNSREYVQTELTQALEAKQLYCVHLSYSLADRSYYAVDALGIAITINQIQVKDAGQIIQKPQITNLPGHIMNNKNDWIDLCGTYRARGNEKYLSIGNFWDNDRTSYVQTIDTASCDSSFIYSYYYIDNVWLYKIDNEFECGCHNDFSVGSDWLSENYDAETGYNSLNLKNPYQLYGKNGRPNDNNSLADNNSNYDSTNINNENIHNDNIDIDISNNSNNENNSTDLNTNNSDYNSGDNISDNNSETNNSILSEISDQAFVHANIGDSFKLNRIFFEFNSAELLAASYSELDNLTEIMRNNTNIHIEIRGHTDNIGSERYNKKLSIDRAASVYNHLIANGINKNRMKYRGFGNTVPIADNKSDSGRRMNRRVEIIIVEL